MIAQDEMAQHTRDTLHVMIVWGINHLEELIGVTLHAISVVVYARETDAPQILLRQKFLIFIGFSISLEVGMAAEEQTPSPRVVGGLQCQSGTPTESTRGRTPNPVQYIPDSPAHCDHGGLDSFP